MNVNQFAIAAGSDRKWLLNSSALLGRPLRLIPENARWWGMVRILEQAFGMTLVNAETAANRAFQNENDTREVVIAEHASSSATMSVDLFRYDTTFLANLSRARVRETPKRRGRRAARSRDPIGRAAAYGLDIGLLKSSLARTPSDRLMLLEANVAFVHAMQRNRRVR